MILGDTRIWVVGDVHLFWAAFEDDLIAYIIVTKWLRAFKGTGRLQTGTPHGYGRQTDRQTERIRSDQITPTKCRAHATLARFKTSQRGTLVLNSPIEGGRNGYLVYNFSARVLVFLRDRTPSSLTINITCLLVGSKRGKKDASNKGKFWYHQV